MENDELKNHVEGRRQEFEVYEFDHDLSWDNISERLDDKQKSHLKVPIKYVWRIAAVFVITLGFTFYMTWLNIAEDNLDAIASTELAEADEYYGGLISTKVLQIRNSNSTIDQDIFRDIDALDQAFVELKEDLKDNADNEEVVNAMILNYKIKLEILEKIIKEMDEEEGDIGRKIKGDEG